tara:strand:+ start:1180 stop:1743 length:564 start_codon:yes stop_codon:yes gene_type:complete
MGFWSTNTDPKRQFNFKVTITGAGGKLQSYMAKTANKPGFTINAAEHQYLNHTFSYPGRLTWNDVAVTFVDPGSSGDSGTGDSASAALALLLADMGYNPPDNSATDYQTISKSKAVTSLGQVSITQMDVDGNELDEWTLINAWVTEVTFGDLDYASDDLVEISCTFKYDFATFKETGTDASGGILGL